MKNQNSWRVRRIGLWPSISGGNVWKSGNNIEGRQGYQTGPPLNSDADFFIKNAWSFSRSRDGYRKRCPPTLKTEKGEENILITWYLSSNKQLDTGNTSLGISRWLTSPENLSYMSATPKNISKHVDPLTLKWPWRVEMNHFWCF